MSGRIEHMGNIMGFLQSLIGSPTKFVGTRAENVAATMQGLRNTTISNAFKCKHPNCDLLFKNVMDDLLKASR